nr:MAG TPA: hypothetical protein [Bacteriophage sp.]DAR53414.1 MAG TPA: hypothetical protein [Caudoviricetes sp.]
MYTNLISFHYFILLIIVIFERLALRFSKKTSVYCVFCNIIYLLW